MNSQFTPEIQQSYADQTHDRMLNDAAHNRLLNDLDGQFESRRSGISTKAKVLFVIVLAALIPLAVTFAASAGNFMHSARKYLVY